MTEDLMHYPSLIDQAMRDVVREVLKRASVSGLPGDHHFYVSFSTLHPGVKMSDQLRARYPKEITIVLQHQFWDFHIEDQRFHVTLSFGGIPEKLTVPFEALTAFADPSVKFGLQFQQATVADVKMANAQTAIHVASAESILDHEGLDADHDPDPDNDSEKVISLENFRKK